MGFFIPALLASSLLWGRPLRIDTDPNLIWVPPGSNTSLQKALYDAAFDPFFRVEQVFVKLVDPSAGGAAPTDVPYGVLQPHYFSALLGLQEDIMAGASSTSGVTLNDVCFRLERGGPCLIQTPLNYFMSSRDIVGNLTSTQDIQRFLACSFPATFCQTTPDWCSPPAFTQPNFTACVKDGVPMMPEVVLGGKTALDATSYALCGEKPMGAQALVLTFLLDSTPGKADAAAEWEKEVFLPLVQSFSSPGLQASFMAERSISDALEIVDEQNQYVVVVSYAAMFMYIIFSLGKFPHPLATRVLLGLQGIIIVLLSVLSALGIWTMLGGHITMIVNEVVPFLILAIGKLSCCAGNARPPSSPFFFPFSHSPPPPLACLFFAQALTICL